MTNKKNINPIFQSKATVNQEYGQSEKLEEKRSVYKKNSEGSIFIKDVNDPSERGHD